MRALWSLPHTVGNVRSMRQPVANQRPCHQKAPPPTSTESIYEVHKGMCFWTRAPLSADDFALDHVLPKSRGGPDNLFNLVPTSFR
jgi:hypothetical protein